jgi:hypothetical protein
VSLTTADENREAIFSRVSKEALHMHTRDETYVIVFMVALIAGWLTHRGAADLNREALAEFHRRIDPLLVKCGDSHYLKIEDRIWWGPSRGTYMESSVVIQWKGLTFITQDRQLSPADRLNGLEWDGRVVPKYDAARVYEQGKGWHPWFGELLHPQHAHTHFMADLQKIRGTWTVKLGSGWVTHDWGVPYSPVNPRRESLVACADIPR